MGNFEDIRGLSHSEVEERVREGKVNVSSNVKTKSIKRIFIDNICTLFNLINVILFVSLLLVGSYKNMLFMGVVLCNTAIGIFQEIRSKRSVDKLTILSESKIEVLRDGKALSVSKDELVLDDIIILSRGNQIPADCVVYSGSCKVNESLLTGESDLIDKREGDELLSGSFITAGKCYAKIVKVGADCYAAKINNEAKYVKKNNSQILKSFKFIIKICTCIIFPIGALLFVKQLFFVGSPIKETVVSTVAAMVGMIPEGMILLTSSVLAVSVIRLSKKKILVNEMYCIEDLARVDTLCLDKTGTLTAEKMDVTEVIGINCDEEEIRRALASIVAASDDINPTLAAIGDYCGDGEKYGCESFCQFSSDTKWSGGCFDNGRSYAIGAAEFVFSDKEKYKEVYDRIASVGQTVRIIALGGCADKIEEGSLPQSLEPMALILIKDQLRDNVNETVDYFKSQGVTLKVISGDSVQTVQNIAYDTGIAGAENAVDMSTVTTDEELYEVAESCNVFGRVTPAQKKQLLLALKDRGHFVAMTGDGVNDVLALKEADCSIAMASGSDAARNVSQLVLVNNDFAAMPDVVAEGRRTINNIERSSSLYLVKTIYSIILSIFFIFFNSRYPFEPIQLTLVGAFTIGFPSFVLALQPNKNRIRGNFTFNVISRAIPAALCVIMNIIAAAIVTKSLGLPHEEFSTISVYLTSFSCLLLIIRLSLPLNALRIAMLIISVSGVTLGSYFFGSVFSLTVPSMAGNIILASCAVATAVIFNLLYNLTSGIIEKKKGQ